MSALEIRKEQIFQACARGYCTKRNSKKVLDPELLQDITEEVLKIVIVIGLGSAGKET